MAYKNELRNQRSGTVINVTSNKMEKDVMIALHKTVEYIINKFTVTLDHVSDLYLKDVVVKLRERYRDVDFSYSFDSSKAPRAHQSARLIRVNLRTIFTRL